MDFISDSLANGSKLRTFNVMDDYNREGLAIEVDQSLPSTRVYVMNRGRHGEAIFEFAVSIKAIESDTQAKTKNMTPFSFLAKLIESPTHTISHLSGLLMLLPSS